jgi:hypothetical protein
VFHTNSTVDFGFAGISHTVSDVSRVVSHIAKFGDASKSPSGDTASPAGDTASLFEDVVASPDCGMCDTAVHKRGVSSLSRWAYSHWRAH